MVSFHILPLKSVIPNFVACFVFLEMAFSFIKLISSSDTLTKREAAILTICPPAIITSAEVIIAEYDAILDQWECEDFYNHQWVIILNLNILEIVKISWPVLSLLIMAAILKPSDFESMLSELMENN